MTDRTDRPCPDCAGAGRRLEDGQIVPCATCGGARTRETEQPLFEPVLTGYIYPSTDPDPPEAA